MSRSTPSPMFKALGLAVILGGVLYGAQAWLNHSGPGDEETASAPGPSDAPASASGAVPTAVPAGRLPAKDIAKAYASDRQATDARFKGQRMQVHGVVDGIEPGQGQVLLITLGADDVHAGLRAVVDGGAQPAARQAAVGQPLGLDCLNQGLLMGEPVLSDCRVLP